MQNEKVPAFRVEVEHKVRHEEWDEATMRADNFFANITHLLSAGLRAGLIDDDIDPDISDLLPYPTLNFSDGSIAVDEMWGVKGRTVWTSSNASGVSGWDEDRQAHVKHYYGSVQVLGDFTSITFRLTDDRRDLLGLARKEDSHAG